MILFVCLINQLYMYLKGACAWILSTVVDISWKHEQQKIEGKAVVIEILIPFPFCKSSTFLKHVFHYYSVIYSETTETIRNLHWRLLSITIDTF